MVGYDRRILGQDNSDASRLNIGFIQLSAASPASICSYVPSSAERIFAASVERKSAFRPARVVVGSSQEAAEMIAVAMAHDQSVDAACIDLESGVVAQEIRVRVDKVE